MPTISCSLVSYLRRHDVIGGAPANSSAIESNIASISAGSPGNTYTFAITNPGAPPSGFSRPRLPIGSAAQRAAYSGSRVNRARSASASSGTASCPTPNAAASASRVKSSGVPPSPPVTSTKSTSGASRRTKRATASISSGTAARIVTLTPMRSSRCASQAPFVSATSPDVSSLPIVRIAAVGIASEYGSVETLDDLQGRRANDCRLTPDRALQSLDEAEAFLRDRGLLTRTTDSALPSLYDACHEEAYKPGSGGFGEGPRTKWPWFGELAERGHLVVAVHRGKNLLVTDEVAAVLDPICRAEIERMRAADPEWDRVLDHLAVAGPSNIEDLYVELGLEPKDLKRLRSPLVRCDDVHSGPGDGDVRQSFHELLLAAVRAAVVAPERELKRWFSWQWYWDATLVEDLVRDGRLRRVDGHVAAGS